MAPLSKSSSTNALCVAFLFLSYLSGQAIEWQPIRISAPPGPYPKTLWKADWPGCLFENGVSEGRVSVLREGEQSWLRVSYPKGSHGSQDGGASWRYPLGVKADRFSAEVRYQVVFEKGFDFNKGGKLPGLCGGPKTITGGDRVSGKDGWSARIMWRKGGSAQAYVYHMNQPSKYGDQFDFPDRMRFVTGEPAQLRLRVTMNAVGARDGTLRVWFQPTSEDKEQLVLEKTDMEWRADESIGANSILFNTFHGGSDESWAPSKDCHARFGNFEWR
jgi:hypothetical protein